LTANNPFPTVYEEKKYYVYWHRDPTNLKILYVGYGSSSRAWMYTTPFRSQEHTEYLENLYLNNYLPDDWVVVVQRGLTKFEAMQIEREQIKLHNPIFNKIAGESILKVTPEILEKACDLRAEGLSYSAIADRLNLSTMTIHRAMAGKSPALEAVLARG